MNNKNLVIKPKKPKGDDGYKVFSVRIRENIVAKVDELSSQTGHSRNELISTFIEYALNRCMVDTVKDE